MWIQIKCGDRFETINTNKINKICLIDKELYINYQHKEFSKFTFKCIEDAKGWYEGFLLAIQGIDFISHSDSFAEWKYDYIKPLKKSKDEALYRHVMLKEILADSK